MSDPAFKDPNIIDRAALSINELQQKLAVLEKRLGLSDERLARHAQAITHLNIWHDGYIYAHVSRLFPKTRSVVFLNPGFFGDNTKYAFLKLHALAEKHGLKCHFLIANPVHHAMLVEQGLPCLPLAMNWTIEHSRILLSAKVVVTSDHFTPFFWNPPLPYFMLQGAKLIQLWHGIPFKEIGLVYNETADGSDVKIASTGPADVLVGPGAAMRKDWERWFSFRQFAPAGYPRNDVMLREPTPPELINVDLDLYRACKDAAAAGRKVIFYAPTFRDKIGLAWFEKANIASFAQWCEAKGYFFFVKTHPFEQEGFDQLKSKMPGVRFARPDSDLYPLLRNVHALVTDYSSLALDYLLLDRPIVFYQPDHADYIAHCRNFLPDYERYMVGPRAMDATALQRAVEETFSGQSDPWTAKRQALRRELFDHVDGNAADRVVELILKQLDAPQELPTGWGP